MDRAAAVGVTRAVTVADDLASARWVVQAAHWDERVAAAVALHPTRTAAGHRRRARRDRAAGRRPAGGRGRRDRARLLLGLLAAGRPAGVLPPAHRPGQAARQAADDPRPGGARRRAAHPARGGRAGDGGLPLLLRGRGDGPGSAWTPVTCCRSPGRSPSATPLRCARPPGWCPRTSCSWRPTRRSSPRTRTAAGRTSRTACPGPCAAWLSCAESPTSGWRADARRTAERVFRLAELPPVGPPATPGERGARSA